MMVPCDDGGGAHKGDQLRAGTKTDETGVGVRSQKETSFWEKSVPAPHVNGSRGVFSREYPSCCPIPWHLTPETPCFDIC